MGLIKICGITRLVDLECCIEAGADLVGLNGWRGSPRFVELARARQLREAARGRIGVVLVTVGLRGADLDEWVGAIEPELVQLTGDGATSEAGRLGSRAYVAIGLRDATDVETARRAPGPFVLVDARDDVRHGGTGRRAPSELVAEVIAARPTVVAGGLGPDDVAATVRALAPHGVDVASGVEHAPGVKNHQAVRQFIAAARNAYAEGGNHV